MSERFTSSIENSGSRVDNFGSQPIHEKITDKSYIESGNPSSRQTSRSSISTSQFESISNLSSHQRLSQISDCQNPSNTCNSNNNSFAQRGQANLNQSSSSNTSLNNASYYTPYIQHSSLNSSSILNNSNLSSTQEKENPSSHNNNNTFNKNRAITPDDVLHKNRENYMTSSHRRTTISNINNIKYTCHRHRIETTNSNTHQNSKSSLYNNQVFLGSSTNSLQEVSLSPVRVKSGSSEKIPLMDKIEQIVRKSRENSVENMDIAYDMTPNLNKIRQMNSSGVYQNDGSKMVRKTICTDQSALKGHSSKYRTHSVNHLPIDSNDPDRSSLNTILRVYFVYIVFCKTPEASWEKFPKYHITRFLSYRNLVHQQRKNPVITTCLDQKISDGETKFNQYLLQEEIGKGSYGIVQLVYNEDDDIHYAMKILSKRKLQRSVRAFSRRPNKFRGRGPGSVGPNRCPSASKYSSQSNMPKIVANDGEEKSNSAPKTTRCSLIDKSAPNKLQDDVENRPSLGSQSGKQLSDCLGNQSNTLNVYGKGNSVQSNPITVMTTPARKNSSLEGPPATSSNTLADRGLSGTRNNNRTSIGEGAPRGRGPYGQGIPGRGQKSLMAENTYKTPEKKDSPLERVYKEIALLKRLSHPNLVKLIQVLDNNEDDQLCMVFELMEFGEVLVLNYEGKAVMPLTEPSARRYFVDCLLGLEYLHHKNLIHRDIRFEGKKFKDLSLATHSSAYLICKNSVKFLTQTLFFRTLKHAVRQYPPCQTSRPRRDRRGHL